jgi:competence protein ComEC
MLEILGSLRELISQAVRQSLPEPQASLLLGMILGVRSGFPSDFYEALRVTGTLHIVVVSGFNITVLINALGRGLSFLALKVRFLIIALAIFLFVFLVGFEAPVVRAAIMGVTALLGTVLGRQKDALRAFLVAGAVMLIFNPEWFSDLNFQLSFLATLGLIVFVPLIDHFVPWSGAPLREDLITTLSAQVLVWPLIAYSFGQFSVLSPLVNALILWTVPISTTLGMVATILAIFVRQVGYLIMLPIDLLLTYFIRVVEWFSSLNFGSFEVSPFSLLALLFYYLILGAGLWFLYQAYLKKRRIS